MLKTIHSFALLALMAIGTPLAQAQVNPAQTTQKQNKEAEKQQARIEKQKTLAEKQRAKAEKQKAKSQADEAKLKRKTEKKRQDFLLYKTPGTVYVFGVSQTLGSPQVFVTDITVIDSLALQKKTKFLPFRSNLSLQLQQYTEGTLGHTHQTTSIFFATNQKKLQKRLSKLKRHVLAVPESTMTLITADQFHFVHPLDLMGDGLDAEPQQ